MTVTSTSRRQVLVVDDDPWTRTVTSALLSSEGYAVKEAKNGEEALRMVRSGKPDVLLLDLALPSMSGLEVLRTIKRDPSTQDVSVLIVSAYADQVAEADASKADGLFAKPFECDDLLDAVRRASVPANPSLIG